MWIPKNFAGKEYYFCKRYGNYHPKWRWYAFCYQIEHEAYWFTRWILRKMKWSEINQIRKGLFPKFYKNYSE